MKIAVIGYSGAGKSTLSKKLAERYRLPLLYLDTVQFESDWKVRDREEGRRIVAQFLTKDNWVIDGNYEKYYQKERLEAADRIVFLNFSRFRCLYRAFLRYKKYKNNTRESMTLGCREKMDADFIKWILFKGRTRAIRSHFAEIVSEYHDKTTVIRNQKQLDAFETDVLPQWDNN